MTYLTVPLQVSLSKQKFSCGKPLLDEYLHKQAKQDIRRKLSACFVLTDRNQNIKGFYTLSAGSIPSNVLPISIKKKMPPSYINLPTTLLGRLAVDLKFQKQGFGELLLLDALRRSYDVSINSIGSFAIIVDPLDAEAVHFYLKYGFVQLPDSGKMFLPMKTIQQLFN